MTRTTSQPGIEKKMDGRDASLSKAVLDRIAAQRIAPRPRWQFVARNAALWIAVAALVFCGALTVALVVFIVHSDAWALRSLLGYSVTESLALMLPLAWIGSGALLVAGAEQALRHTRRGYRYSLTLLLGGIAAASVVGGLLLYRAGVGAMADEGLHRLIPAHPTVEMRRRVVFHDPVAGRVMGRVIAADQPAGLLLVVPPAGDADGDDLLLIDIRSVPREQAVAIALDDEVMALGAPDGGVFRACDVRPLPAYGEGRMPRELRKVYKEMRRDLRRTDDDILPPPDDALPPSPTCGAVLPLLPRQ